MSNHKLRSAHWFKLTGLILLTLNTKMVFSEPVRGDTVTTRIHPELIPSGIHINSFRMHPGFTYTGMLNDNVFADDNIKKSSYVSEYSPELSLLSNWNKHALNVFLTYDIGRNHTFSGEDYEDWELATDGKLDVTRNIEVSGGTSVTHDHIERTSPDDARGIIPTEFDKTVLFGNYRQRSGLFSLNINTSLEKRDYHNVPGIQQDSIIIIDNDVRDRTITSLKVRGNYKFIHNQQVFVRYKINQRDYDNLKNSENNDRSSDGYAASIGFDLDLSGIIVGDISIGYASQHYIEPFPDISKLLVNALINWNISDLTTIRFERKHTLNETFINDFSGYISSTTELGIDHELRRNLLLGATLLYRSDHYAGTGDATRNDQIYDIVLSSTYTVTRNFNVSMQYHYLERESIQLNTANNSNDFTNNVLFIQLQTQY